ncbi:bacillithiol biosynthesis cysteine-adding enzyme BshC [Luteitalea pratensis]|uniref:Putative cysteine ligase BshC n=2 Tax=Luteitalea pratensis TaxID=1855912 RepID=A0A143PTH9_LUTPR|nr:bacillithiol biosynthesis cysteine-adding enzyme BshC [Luteitalea pratensis]
MQAAQPQGIDLRQWSGSRLSLDYTYQHEKLARYYAGDPANPDAWRDVITRVQAHPRDRAAMVAILEAQLAARQAPEQARAAAAKLADPRTVAIVTGQQAGLFGGPLYTLMKGLTAARLAADIEAQYGVPCVTVFWNHAEDHDWEEVASAWILDDDLQAHRLTVAGIEGDGHVPVGQVRLTEDITRVLAELDTLLPQTEFTAATVAQLRRCYAPGTGMADAFGQLLDVLLGPLGVVVFDGSDPAAKPLASTIFQRVLAHPGHTRHLASDTGQALVADGYHAQVVTQPDATALFSMVEGRSPIKYRDEQLLVGETPVDAATLRADAAAHPERFSPNVLLRAVVQDTLLPTIAYVAGPSELAYLGQLKNVYAFHETPMPLIVQRATGTILDSASLRFLARTSLELQSLQAQDEHALNQWLEAQLPPTLEQALHDLEHTLDERMAALLAAVPALDPTLDGAVKSSQGRLAHEVRGLHAKVISAAKRRNETLRRQFAHAQHLAFPGGHPQERVLCLAWYMNRFGPALVPRLYECLPIEGGKHWLLQI